MRAVTRIGLTRSTQVLQRVLSLALFWGQALAPAYITQADAITLARVGEALCVDAQCTYAQLSAQFHNEGYVVDLDDFWDVHMDGLSSRDEMRAVFAVMRQPRFRNTRMGLLLLTSPTYNVDSELRTRTVLMGSACHVTDRELGIGDAVARVAASDVQAIFEANRIIHLRLDGRVPPGDSVLRFFLDLAVTNYPLRIIFGTTTAHSNTHWGARYVFGIIPITDKDFKFLLTQRRGPYKLLDLTDVAVREAICRLFDRYPRVGHQHLRELYCARPGQWDPAPLFE